MIQEAQRAFNFVDTTATQKIFSLKKRIRAVAGGTAASKTISIIVWLIDYCQSFRGIETCSVVSESFPHLERGAMKDFESIMKDRNYWVEDRWNKTKHVYTFETGNQLEFITVDTYGKAHGPRREILFLNEANNIAYNIADQLITRTKKIVWMDWNPSEEFWFYTEMNGKRDDVDFITLTYKDNEALDEITIKEIESHKHNKSWWSVYGLGQLGQREENIYNNWKIIDEAPHEAKLLRRGLDFGYSTDPTALSAIYRYDGGYILDEEIYLKGLSNKQIADTILNLEENKVLVKADSAEPKSIDEIRSYGVNILPALKGKDSINHGIQKIQDLKISITKRSLNAIKEYRNYRWETDKQGNITRVPKDTFNHFMDSIRYAFEGLEEKEIEPYIQPHYQPTEFEGHGRQADVAFLATPTGGKITINPDYQQNPITD